jgi:hypothetical protein
MSEHLTHGWEPDTPASDSLVRQFLEGTAERGEFFAATVGGRATRQAGIAMVDLESAVWFDNAVVLLAPCELLDRAQVLDAINDFYPPERTVIVFSAFHTWDLTGDGFELVGHPPFMVRPPGPGSPRGVAGLEIQAVKTAEDAATFGHLLAEAYPMPGAEGSPLVRTPTLDGPLRLFIAVLGGKPVATGGTWNSHGVNDVGWISALPETRRKGVGAAITHAATVADPTAPAVLLASDDGLHVYENLGYIALLRMTLWLRPGA